MHQSLTRQLGYMALGSVLALALTVGFTTVARADTSTTTGTTTTSYVFDADLSGANQVPPVSATTSTSTNGMGTTTATTTGHARVWFDMTSASGTATTTTMMWKTLSLWNGDDITAAHLHCGLPGASGPVVLDLIHIASSTDVNGVLVATSSAGMDDLHATTTGCSMPITNMTDLANALKAGIIYANVHSVQYPSGVVRGQMMLTSQVSTSTTGNGHTCTNQSGNTGWYDNAGVWHSCGNSGNGTCTGTSTPGMGWYDNGGVWHSCSGNTGTGNCSTSSTSAGWWDSHNNWHSCGTGGTNGNGSCSTTHSQGWYDSNGMWHWCNQNGGGNGNGGGNNGGGTTTHPMDTHSIITRVFDRIRGQNGSSTPAVVSGKSITQGVFDTLNGSLGGMFHH